MSNGISIPIQKPLYLAAYSGRADAVLHLLNHGVLPDAPTQTDSGYTPLYAASHNGHTRVVQLLLEHGADADKARTGTGSTPLFAASGKGHIDVVTLLLQHGADADKARTDDGSTPLWMASTKGHTDVVTLLLQHGADADKARTTDGATPLYAASGKGHTDVTRVLLQHGADADKARTTDGASPLHVASEVGHPDVVRLLLHHGTDIDKATTTTGVTPLFFACIHENAGVIKLLVFAGANTGIVVMMLTYMATVNAAAPPNADSRMLSAFRSLAAAGTNLRFVGDVHLQMMAAQHYPLTAAWVRSARDLPPLQICASLGSELWFRWLLRLGGHNPLTTPGLEQSASSDAMRRLCREARRPWTPSRHGLYPVQHRLTVWALHAIHLREQRYRHVPLEVWQIICAFIGW
jgi:ankyrin repeat protein